jgi:hypothetical protein
MTVDNYRAAKLLVETNTVRGLLDFPGCGEPKEQFRLFGIIIITIHQTTDNKIHEFLTSLPQNPNFGPPIVNVSDRFTRRPGKEKPA